MDRRTVIAVVVSIAIYYAWIAFRGKPEQPAEPAPETVTTEEPAPTAQPAPTAEVAPVPAATAIPAQEVPFEACGARARIGNDGGIVFDAVLPAVKGAYQVTPIYRWVIGRVTGSISGPWEPYGGDPGPARLLSEHAQALRSGVGAGPSEPLQRFELTAASPSDVTLSGELGGVRLDERIAEHREGNACTIDVTTTWTNPGAAPWTGTVWTTVLDHTTRRAGRYESQHQPTALVDGSVKYGGSLGAGCIRRSTQLSDTSGPIDLPGAVSWFGFCDRYFGLYVLPDRPDLGQLRFQRVGTGDDSIDGPVLASPATLAPGGALSWHSRVYVGENHLADLDAVDSSLDRVVDLGWFAVFGKPLLWIMQAFHGVSGSWGLSIILLTVSVKVLFFPMTHRAMKSAQKMQEIQPELSRIREEYADRPDEMNRLVLEVMTQNKVNPATGCLPMFVQMPVFFALYQVLLTNVEFYQEPFVYVRDLSSPDPYCVLPLAVTLLMWGQQRLSTPPANMEPAQQALLRWMPLMFGLFFFASPSGLGVYMLVNMSLSILQQWIIRRTLGGKKLPAQVVPF